MGDQGTANGNQMHILMAEDSPTQAAGLKAILTEKWDDVRWAKDGGEALKMMRQCRPALVVSDIEMPVLTGYELSRLMKGDEALKAVPIILLTELASPNAIAQTIDSKADCLLMKPYDPERLFAVIDRVLAETISPEGDAPPGEADRGKVCDVTLERDRLRKLLKFALDELADQHRRLIAAEERLEIM
jgi:two-component system NtrC family sensor kinase